ncbi:DUF3783 domain-containing protein [Pseudoflavonifractor sp. 524-17]|uniref:DUF3783 domain-containing protein n=1 Tax=Pseudoflavonifractor sp. 524-17 TaxID=2304577 RepID=UPI00137A7DD2|nr:DUF3783 domain-containing protein [Pseudoflavonifractor sp. 524-17]NCE64162.1 DUF3783 domain-containing protein [Pseudoflavonifractor sp. 524-17]
MARTNGMVLYYNGGSEEEAAKAKLVFVRLGLRIKMIPQELLGQAVGSFAGIKTQSPVGEGTGLIPDSIMVFSGVGGRALDQVLAALVKAGVSQQVYKAVLTPGNAAWSFCQLYDELVKERQAVESGGSGNSPS